MKAKRNRILSLALVVAMMLTLLPGTVNAVTAPVTPEAQVVINTINNYAHGGSGKLMAVADQTVINQVNVTGTVTGATNSLELLLGPVTVKWKATLVGDLNAPLIYVSGGSSINNISGTFEVPEGGLIENTGGSGIAIRNRTFINNVEVSGGTVRSTNSPAIWSHIDPTNGDGYASIKVSGGLVEATGTSISAVGISAIGAYWESYVRVTGGRVKGAWNGICGYTNASIIISGGVVEGYQAIDSQYEVTISGGTIVGQEYGVFGRYNFYTNKPVNITMNDGQVIATSSYYGVGLYTQADSVKPAGKITMNSGIVLGGQSPVSGGYGAAIDAPGYTGYTGTGITAIWKIGEGLEYEPGSTTGLGRINPDTATAYWSRQAGVSGISYENGTNTGFFPIPGVSVGGQGMGAEDLIYEIPTDHVYNGTPQSIGTVTGPSGMGAITVKYNGSTVLPVDAGTYAVTVDIAAGNDYNAVTDLNLGDYTIAKAPAPVITWPTAADVTYGAVLASVELSGGSTEYGSFSWVDGSIVPDVENSGYYVIFTPDASTERNYEPVSPNTQIVSVMVDRAEYPGEKTANFYVQSDTYDHNDSSTYTFDLSMLLANIHGAVLNTPNGTGPMITDVNVVGGTKLQVTVTPAAANTDQKIVIPVTSANYFDFDIIVTITAVDKHVLTFDGVSITDVDYGTGISIDGTPTVISGENAGTFDISSLRTSFEGTGTTSYNDTTAPTQIGTYKLVYTVLASDPDYTGTYEIPFAINPRVVTLTWDNYADLVYNGNVQLPVATVSNLVNGDSVVVTVTGGQTDAGGPYTATAAELIGAAAENYRLPGTPATQSFSIGKADPDVGIVSYTGDAIYTSTSVATVNADLNYSGSTPGSIALNIASFTRTGTSSHEWTFTPADGKNYHTTTGSITLTVSENTPTRIDIGMTVPDKIVYEHGDFFETSGLTVTATFANGDTLEVTDAVEVIYDTGEALSVGDNSVMLSYTSGGVTHTCTVSGLTVNKKGLDVSQASWDYSMPFTYDGKMKTVTLAGLPEGILATYSGNRETDAGNYTATVTLALESGYSSDHYEISGDINALAWVIEKAPYNGVLPVLRYEIADTGAGEKTVTIVEVTGAEYSFDGITYSQTRSLTVDDEAIILLSIRIVESDNYWESGMVSQMVDLSKEEQAPPAAFELIVEGVGETSYTVTIPALEGAEYSFDGVEYSDANVLTNCAPGITVTGFVRRKGNDTQNPSPATSGSVTLPIFQVETPVASPNGGKFTSSQSVTLSTATQGATIYYTLDGKTPTANSTEYDGTFSLATTTEVKAIAVKEGLSDSEVLSVTFTKTSGGSKSSGSKSTNNQTASGDENETIRQGEENTTGAESGSVNPFSDVTNTSWYYEAVKYVYENGIMQGTGNGAFEPDTKLNRAMLVQMLFNLEKQPATGLTGFRDVAAEAWYADAITWAASNNIVNGIGNGLFGPTNEITREQMAVMLYNYCEYKGITLPADQGRATFTDANTVSDWAEPAVSAMYRAGILTGKGSGVFDPQGTATRAEVAQMFMTFLEMTK